MEIRVSMVADGPDCCRSGRRVHIDRLVSSGKWAPVQSRVAKARLKHALSSATWADLPFYSVQIYFFVLDPVYIRICTADPAENIAHFDYVLNVHIIEQI